MNNQTTKIVGRDYELQTLSSVHCKLGQNNCSAIVYLDGESGSGKSFLIESYCKRLAGLKYIRLTFEEGRQHSPFIVFTPLVKELLANIAVKNERLQLIERFSSYSQTLLSLYPELSEIFGDKAKEIEETNTLTSDERLIRAVSALLEICSNTYKDLVLFIDDIQWANNIALNAIFNFIKKTSNKTLLVLAYRTRELPNNSFINNYSADANISLSALGSENEKKLIESLIGPTADNTINIIRNLARSNSFLITTITKGLLESGALIKDGALWEVDQSSANQKYSSDDYLKARLRLLDHECLRLVKVAALIGKRFNLKVIATALNNQSDYQSSILTLEHRSLIKKSSTEEYEFIHDKLREAALELVEQNENNKLHYAIATAFEKVQADELSQIADHYNKSGDLHKSFSFSLKAARDAKAKNLLQQAAYFYKQAWERFDKKDKTTVHEISADLGEVLMGQGEYDQAIECLNTAINNTDDRIKQARIYVTLARLHTFRLQTSKSIQAIEDGLSLLNFRLPKNNLIKALALSKEIFIQSLHTIFPRALNKYKASQSDNLIAELLVEMGYPLYFECRMFDLLYAHILSLNMLERFEECDRLGHILASHGVLLSAVPWISRAIEYGERALALRIKLKSSWGLGNSYHFLGLIYLVASRFNDAIDVFLKSRAILSVLGYRWDEGMVSCNMAYAAYRLGNLTLAIEEAKRCYDETFYISNLQGLTPGLSAWSKASAGLIPDQILEQTEALSLKLNLTKDLQTLIELEQAKAIWHLNRKEYDQGITLLEQAYTRFREARISQEYVVAAVPWLLTALRLKWQSKPESLNKSDIRRVFKTASAALSYAKKFKNNLPHVYREYAIIYSLIGKNKLSSTYFNLSLKIAESHMARYEKAQTIFERGKAGKRLGWKEADDNIEHGYQLLKNLDANMSFFNKDS